MNKKGFLLFIMSIIITNMTHSQMIREWKIVCNGSFTGTDVRNNFSNVKGKYFAALQSGTTANEDSAGKIPVCFLSSDSGKTFKEGLKVYRKNDPNMPNVASQEFNGVEMPSENLILVIGNERYNNDPKFERYPFLMRSTNFGNSWEKIRIIKDSIPFESTVVSMLNDTFGIMISARKLNQIDSNQRGLFKTFDGGKTWKEYKFFNCAYIILVKCFSQDEFIIQTTTGVHITKDGGISWVRMNAPSTYCNFNFKKLDLWYATYVSNNKGYVMKSSDMGNNWQMVSNTITSPDGPPSGFNVDFYDNNNGIVAGEYPSLILRTTDGGKTWSIETIPAEIYTVPFKTPCFFAKEKAILLSIDNILLYTGKMVLQPPKVSIAKFQTLMGFAARWDTIIGSDKYKIQVAETRINQYITYDIPDFETKIIINDSNLKNNLYDLEGKLKFNKLYYIRVKAYNGDQESDWSKFINFKTPKDTGNYPTLSSCILIEPNLDKSWPNNSIKFIWNKVENAKTYNLFVSSVNSMMHKFIDFEEYGITDTTFTLNNFYNGEQYLCWIIAQAEKWNDSPLNYFSFFIEPYTGINEINLNNILSISPNPASDYIEIKQPSEGLKPSEGYSIQIFNLVGEKVEQTFLPVQTSQTGMSDLLKIDVSNLAPGVYFIRIGDKFEKFVKW